MLLEALKQVYLGKLTDLQKEIEGYKDEQTIWRVREGISNSGGNLALHLVGNLNQYIGVVLGGTDYVRNREAEFGLKDVPRAKLLQQIEDTKSVLALTLSKLDPAVLELDYPTPFNSETRTTQWVLIWLISHFGYHLGQVNYHRRLLEGALA
jgi:hypothetical protein